MITRDSTVRREIHSCHSGIEKNRQVGVVGHPPVHSWCCRGRIRKWRRVSELIDQPRIVRTGLEHHRRPEVAAHLEIQHDLDVVERRVGLDETLRAEQAKFLALGEQNDEIVAQRRAGLERAKCFEDRGDGRRIVACAGAARDRVVVRDHHDCAGGLCAGNLRDHVVHDGPSVRAKMSRDSGGLHFWIRAEFPQSRDEIFAHANIFG